MFLNAVVYYPIDDRIIKIYIRGLLLGQVTRGSATCLFSTPDGRKKLYGSMEEFEQELVLLVRKYTNVYNVMMN